MIRNINMKTSSWDIIADIDESKYGKDKYNRAHPVADVWIVGAIERFSERNTVLESFK